MKRKTSNRTYVSPVAIAIAVDYNSYLCQSSEQSMTSGTENFGIEDIEY
jgi:hypothetical protein